MRILIVDDNVDQLAALQLWLQHQNHEVVVVSNGLDALSELQRKLPDILITDLSMPDMNGIELIRHVKARFPQVPIVAASGKDSLGRSGNLRQALSAGASHALKKPFTMEELNSTIQKLADALRLKGSSFLPKNSSHIVAALFIQLFFLD